MKEDLLFIKSLSEIREIPKECIWDNICFSEDIVKNGEVSSLNEAYNIFLRNIYGNDAETGNYSVQQIYIDGRKYFQVERRNLILEEEQRVVLDLLTEEFGDSLFSVGVFGSYITKEDGEYSDFDLVVVLDNYEDSNIYEREKSSPKMKKRLREHGVHSLFAFNFTTKQELEGANKDNPWLLETMGKSFYTIIDRDNFLEGILTSDRGIEYQGNFIWEGESLNNNSNLANIDRVLLEYREVLNISKQSNFNEFEEYYSWEVKKLEIIKKLLDERNLFVSRFDFDSICKDILEIPEEELNELYSLYSNGTLNGKRTIYDYESIGNNIEFSNSLLDNGMVLPSLQHRYIALRNILSHLLHRTGNFIIDGEFTQKFLQVFGEALPSEIKDDFYEDVFKTEQILGRTGYLSFDLDEDGQYIFEQGNYDYYKLIEVIDRLIEYFQESSIQLLDEVGEKETKILIVSSGKIDTRQFIYPTEIQVINSQELDSKQEDKKYIIRLNSNHSFSPDYILKLLSGFNKKGVKCVTGNRVSLIKGAEAKFSNFAFKREDYEKDGKGIFRHALRSVGTEYFTS